MGKGETIRVDMRISAKLIEEIERYQDEEGITTRTGAILELVRVGLKASNREKTN
jgi:metal-responsive CopG/Arc/MetJ family transcriptional regulator